MNTKPTYLDRRRFPRVSLPCHLRFRKLPKSEAEYRNAVVLDISQGGFRFSTFESFQRRSCFLLDLILPGLPPVHSLATVAWVKALPEEAGYQVGGVFVEPNAEVENALVRLASRH